LNPKISSQEEECFMQEVVSCYPFFFSYISLVVIMHVYIFILV